MTRLVSNREVVAIQRRRLVAFLDGPPVIDERADRNTGCERRNAADVIAVVMRDDQVIDPHDARLCSRRSNPIGVTTVEAGPAGIDEHRLSSRRDEQGGLTTLDVDEINLQRLRGRLRDSDRSNDDEQDQQHEVFTHANLEQ